MQISVGNMGAVIGTQLYRTEYAPRFFVGHGVACGYMIANLGVVCLLWSVLIRENRMKERILEEVGGGAGGKEEGSGGLGTEGEVEGWRADEDPRWKFQT